MITVFLGAGFSAVAGLPLAQSLFDEEPIVDVVSRQRLVHRVLSRWRWWLSQNKGAPEEYLAHLQDLGGRDWLEAVWYVGLVIALKMGRVENVGMKPTVTRHNLNRTTGVPAHEEFWSSLFRRTDDVAVVTTNYDVLIERGIRTQPRPRVLRPGFHYGSGAEELAGGGYPSYAHIQKIVVSGKVSLLKLHGSVSWAYRQGKLIRYHDCRPAIRGDAAIVAPVTQKRLPDFLAPTWAYAAHALSSSHRWLFVGYSLPEYDELVLRLLRENASHKPEVHVFDPQLQVAESYRALLGLNVSHHQGLPDGISDMQRVVL